MDYVLLQNLLKDEKQAQDKWQRAKSYNPYDKTLINLLFDEWQIAKFYSADTHNEFNFELCRRWFSTNDWDEKLAILLEFKLVALAIKNNETRFVNQKPYNGFWSQLKHLRWWVYLRDDSVCQYCFAELDKTNAHVDHVIPSSAFPGQFLWLANDSTNLVASCSACNLSKNNKLKFPQRNAHFIALEACQPTIRKKTNSCSLTKHHDEICPKCLSKTISIMCNVHGYIYAFSCQLSSKSGCDGIGL